MKSISDWVRRYLGSAEGVHTGQSTFYAGVDYIKSLYPRFDDFRKLRGELDPKRMFYNRFVDGVFLTP
jgi:D-arabinono-1,4-lactone oxidase.